MNKTYRWYQLYRLSFLWYSAGLKASFCRCIQCLEIRYITVEQESHMEVFYGDFSEVSVELNTYTIKSVAFLNSLCIESSDIIN